MKRYSIENLKNWREKPNRKPLVLSGARQVGKTWLLKEFGRTCFAKTAYVNFDKSDSAKALFEGDFDLRGILSGLQALCDTEITPEDCCSACLLKKKKKKMRARLLDFAALQPGT